MKNKFRHNLKRFGMETEFIKWMKEDPLKVGDKVRITRSAKSHSEGWDNTWISNMNKYIGTETVVTNIYGGSGISLLNCEGYRFPSSVLERIRRDE